MTKDYVLGFLFDAAKGSVVLIQKNRPEWQCGKYNGVGGKIELGESPREAMVREFEEETGVRVPQWTCFNTITGDQAADPTRVASRIYCFYAVDENKFWAAESMTDEKVEQTPLCIIDKIPAIPHIKWLIPQALANASGEWPYRYQTTTHMPVSIDEALDELAA